MTDRKSFEDVLEWLEEIRSYANRAVKVVLVANKVDQQHKRAVMREEAEKFAQLQEVGYAETSAMSGENVEATFHNLANALLNSDFGESQMVMS